MEAFQSHGDPSLGRPSPLDQGLREETGEEADDESDDGEEEEEEGEEEEGEDKTNRNTRLVDGPYVHTTICLRLEVLSFRSHPPPLTCRYFMHGHLKVPKARS